MSWPPSRRVLLSALGAVTALVVALVVVVLVSQPHDVSHPNLSFTAPPSTTTKARPATVDNFTWPRYGYSASRTHAFTADADLKPPFRRGWTYGGNALIEFPPSIHGHNLYFMDDSATVKDVDAVTGHTRWEHRIGTLSAATPALGLSQGMLYVPTLSDTGKSPGNGQIAALSLATGRTIWHHPIPSGTESSPLVFGNALYFGTQSGTVYALNAETGARIWSFQASGAVKGGPALDDGRIFVDDYGGHVYALSARTGKQIWSAGTSSTFSSGTFYSTPAVAFGRVYAGNTNGYVYSYAADTGQLAWSTGTGAYVYSSAAVDDVPGLGPTIFMGSYDGYFYAFNAQSGAIRWKHRDAKGDRISGSAQVINGVVYYSDLDDGLTTGLDIRSGRTVFTFGDGAFSPAVADPGTLFISGRYVEYELLPALTRAQRAAGETRKRAAAAAKQKAQAKQKKAAAKRKRG